MWLACETINFERLVVQQDTGASDLTEHCIALILLLAPREASLLLHQLRVSAGHDQALVSPVFPGFVEKEPVLHPPPSRPQVFLVLPAVLTGSRAARQLLELQRGRLHFPARCAVPVLLALPAERLSASGFGSRSSLSPSKPGAVRD